MTGVRGAVNAPLLLTLARSSGGEAATHAGFGSLFGSCALPAALTARRLGDHATLDCFASGGVRLVQWMGAVDVLKVGGGGVRVCLLPCDYLCGGRVCISFSLLPLFSRLLPLFYLLFTQKGLPRAAELIALLPSLQVS